MSRNPENFGSCLAFQRCYRSCVITGSRINITQQYCYHPGLSEAPSLHFKPENRIDASTNHTCHYCHLSFQSLSDLKLHKQSVHLRQGMHFCPICGKGIIRKDDFMDHINRHKNIKAHQCPQCLRYFTFKRNLLQHMHGKCPSRFSDNV